MAKKKKYHGSMRDGMKYNKNDGYYTMISEDSSKFAYLPQEVMSKKYPDMDYNSEMYEQGRHYQDQQMMEMEKQAKKQRLNKHF